MCRLMIAQRVLLQWRGPCCLAAEKTNGMDGMPFFYQNTVAHQLHGSCRRLTINMLCCMLDSIAQTGCSVACFFLHMHALMHVGGEDKCLAIDIAWG